MDRREFLKKGSLYVAGAFIAGTGFFNKKAFAETAGAVNFSIDVVTGSPDAAIRKIDQLIKSSVLKNHRINFTEYQLPGQHIGDIAFVKSNRLIDFYQQTDPFSVALKEAAASLDLPKSYEKPVLLRFFSNDNSGVAKRVNIFRGDILIDQLSIAENRVSHRVSGDKGHVHFSIKDGAVRITSTSCKHKTCMDLGTIRRPGESLVCIPNRLSAVIEGANDFGVDGITF